MQLALFDLDHTLIPFDSGMAWTRFLITRGVLGAEFESIYLEECKLYVTGALDIHALHRTMVAPLGRLPREELRSLLKDFGTALRPTLPAGAQALVERHRAAGNLCCVVTATTRFIAERYACGFGIEHLLATEAAVDTGGALTGEIDGLPCYREHKLAKLHEWLRSRDQGFGDFDRCWFYSDSFNDLRLLRAVSDPVAVRPDARLRALAETEGWPIEMLSETAG
ncbi:MAG: HAD-IB family hydrolase [Methylibium sp.]|uniref:HAD family hydrolase n=1 Tax=Methylibium sp. TaxID=2067992 RepID=UPI00183D14AD|nr:HAD family phosphatase [Methylibium sp.]MBA3598263.1 HAD-IB family hydrolase [Methylibium sp.]